MGCLTTVDRDGVSVIAIERPPANAMDLGLLEELVVAAERLAEEPPPAVVLTGHEGFFSAGLDLKAVPGYDAAQQRRMVELINRMALGYYALACPVVCAITGHAIAGGLVLALCGDHRVASTAGRYGLTEVKVGVPYPQAAIGVVKAELTAAAARVLVLGNRLLGAAACAQLGVFDEAVAPREVLDRAVAVAQELAGLPAGVYDRTKAELRAATVGALAAAAADDPLLDDRVASVSPRSRSSRQTP